MIREPQVSIVDETDIAEARITLRSDSIMHVHYKKDTVFDIPLQLKMRAIYDRMTNGKKTKFIFSADEGVVFTKEARENAHHLQNESPILCYALVTNSLAYKIIANFYIRVMKPFGSYKLVSSIDEAVNWLHSINEDGCAGKDQ